MQILGGQDRDTLSTQIFKPGSGSVPISATVNGGSQTDTCSTAGSNVPVTVLSCP